MQAVILAVFTKTYNYSDYSFGSTNDSVVATATDSAGNSTTETITIAVSKGDNQAPSISSFTVDDDTVVVSTSSQYQTVTFTVTAGGENVASNYTDIKIVDVATGAVIAGPQDATTAGLAQTFTFTDYYYLSAGQSRTFKVTADIAYYR